MFHSPIQSWFVFIAPALNLTIKVQVKVKVTLEQATKSQRRSRDIALLFL
jgi:hypothetical protein